MRRGAGLIRLVWLAAAGGVIAPEIAPDARASTSRSSWWGRVGAVADGDTITVVRKQRWPTRIVLHGVDAPELDQPFGEDAKRLVSKLAFGKQVRVEEVGEDRQARALVARVYIGTLGLSEALLTAGMAWHDRCQGVDAYRALEAAAKRARRGLWAGAKPVAPWIRRGRRGSEKKQPCPVLVAPSPTSGLEGALRRIAGSAPPPRPVPRRATPAGTRPPGRVAGPPKLPRSPDRSCRSHRDCVFAFRSPCFCSPCGAAWRRVSSRAAYQRHKQGWACKVPSCAPCPLCPQPTHWLGSKPVCVKGQCTVR